MFSYGEEMSTDPLEAMMLKQLVFMTAPRRVLEIGMFVGYGSVGMLEGSPEARVVSLEIDPYLKTWLSECLSSYPQITERHEVVLGPALDSLPKLTGEFDMVFVDANKAEYHRYVELILEHNLLSATGVIVCDNILYNGYPYVQSHFDSQPARRGFGDAIREFNQWVCDHPELSQVVGRQDAYCVSQSKCEGPAMRAVREKMLRTPWGEEWDQKRTMFSYGEEMSTDPLEAMLLKQLVFMTAPRRVLEIGMFVGYGSVAMMEGSPAARVVSLEIDPYLKTWLSECLSSYPQITERHEVVLGPALDSL